MHILDFLTTKHGGNSAFGLLMEHNLELKARQLRVLVGL